MLSYLFVIGDISIFIFPYFFFISVYQDGKCVDEIDEERV